MDAHDAPAEREPKPGSAGLACSALVGAVEGLEDPLEVLLGDAGPSVAHLEDEPIGMRARLELHGAPLGGVAGGVLEEVVDDAPEQRRIALERRQRAERCMTSRTSGWAA